jgi:hypothetical protein
MLHVTSQHLQGQTFVEARLSQLLRLVPQVGLWITLEQLAGLGVNLGQRLYPASGAESEVWAISKDKTMVQDVFIDGRVQLFRELLHGKVSWDETLPVHATQVVDQDATTGPSESDHQDEQLLDMVSGLHRHDHPKPQLPCGGERIAERRPEDGLLRQETAYTAVQWDPPGGA